MRKLHSASFVGSIPIASFLLVVTLAFYGVQQPGTLGIKGAPCDTGWCVSSVYPASFAWSEGIREGDSILLVNNTPIPDWASEVSWRQIQSIEVIGDRPEPIFAEVTPQPIGESPLKWSLWLVAAFFAILGSLVWSRRSDLPSATALGRMTTFAAISLAIGPAAGGPQLPWALTIQFPALAVLSFTFFDFVYKIVGEHGEHSPSTDLLRRVLATASIAALIGYVVSVVAVSSLYEFVFSLWALTFIASLLASVALLLVAVIRAPGDQDEGRLRVPLLGMLLGVTPFPIATIAPLAVGVNPLAPHLTVLPVILMPSAFAYSILHDQLWGIRRLVHRGLVYGLLSASVLAITVGGVAITRSILSGQTSGTGDFVSTSVIVIVGIMLFSPLRRATRKLADRIIYGNTPSYPEFVQGLQRDLASADPESELPDTLTRVLAEHLDLESAVLMAPDEQGQPVTISSVGNGVQRVLDARDQGRITIPDTPGEERPALLPFEGEQILCLQLWAAEQNVGTVLLGPKAGGELFITDEISLVGNAAPFMAAALERHAVSQTMRQLNKRLIDTDEESRQRIAIDLHDGPLQKAVALAIGRVVDPDEQREVATNLVNELRDISSRLRPSILDDLGLPESIDWLLEHGMPGTDIRGTLELEGLDEDQRLDPDAELALFRVTQEALNNIVKHAQATEVRVTLERDEDQVALTIKDDGVGMGGSEGDPFASTRLGMVGMRERIRQVGGDMQVVSFPNRGVLIQATVPNTSLETDGVRSGA